MAKLFNPYRWLTARPVTHPDDAAVDRFAAAMKAKLAKKRAEGRSGWDDKAQCTGEFLSALLREHVDKGDPLDVGNLAMMLHQRGERISAPAVAAQAPQPSLMDGATYRCRKCGEQNEIMLNSARIVTRLRDGYPRDPRDTESDPAGTLIHDPAKPLYAAPVAAQDEALLRQALEALERGAWDTLSGRNAAFAIRERLGLL